jgi:pheromone a factor receptor
MFVSVVEILGTIPLGTYYIVRSSKSGVTPWRGWTYTHEDYSAVYQIPASIWKNNSQSVFNLEMYRWSLVLCAFLFFALFGFAEEARRHYRQMYASVVSRIGYATSALHKSSHEYVVHSVYGSIATHGCFFFSFFFSTSSVPYVRSNDGITVTVVKTGGEKQDSSISLTDRSSVLSISIANNNKNPDFKVGQHSLSNTVTSSSVESFHESKTQDLSTLPAVPVVIIPTAPPATVPPHFPETTRSTLRAYSSYDVV